MQWRDRAPDILASRGFTRDGRRGILAAADRRPTPPRTPGAPPSEASPTLRSKVRRLLPRVRPPTTPHHRSRQALQLGVFVLNQGRAKLKVR